MRKLLSWRCVTYLLLRDPENPLHADIRKVFVGPVRSLFNTRCLEQEAAAEEEKLTREEEDVRQRQTEEEDHDDVRQRKREESEDVTRFRQEEEEQKVRRGKEEEEEEQQQQQQRKEERDEPSMADAHVSDESVSHASNPQHSLTSHVDVLRLHLNSKAPHPHPRLHSDLAKLQRGEHQEPCDPRRLGPDSTSGSSEPSTRTRLRAVVKAVQGVSRGRLEVGDRERRGAQSAERHSD
eukprot:1937677-Rhodomonas_salina.1